MSSNIQILFFPISLPFLLIFLVLRDAANVVQVFSRADFLVFHSLLQVCVKIDLCLFHPPQWRRVCNGFTHTVRNPLRAVLQRGGGGCHYCISMHCRLLSCCALYLITSRCCEYFIVINPIKLPLPEVCVCVCVCERERVRVYDQFEQEGKKNTKCTSVRRTVKNFFTLS